VAFIRFNGLNGRLDEQFRNLNPMIYMCYLKQRLLAILVSNRIYIIQTYCVKKSHSIVNIALIRYRLHGALIHMYIGYWIDFKPSLNQIFCTARPWGENVSIHFLHTKCFIFGVLSITFPWTVRSASNVHRCFFFLRGSQVVSVLFSLGVERPRNTNPQPVTRLRVPPSPRSVVKYSRGYSSSHFQSANVLVARVRGDSQSAAS
jgi:hypothetical protein